MQLPISLIQLVAGEVKAKIKTPTPALSKVRPFSNMVGTAKPDQTMTV